MKYDLNNLTGDVVPQIVKMLAGDDKDAVECIDEILTIDPFEGLRTLHFFNDLELSGKEICLLWQKHNRNLFILSETLKAYNEQTLSKEAIFAILDSKSA